MAAAQLTHSAVGLLYAVDRQYSVGSELKQQNGTTTLQWNGASQDLWPNSPDSGHASSPASASAGSDSPAHDYQPQPSPSTSSGHMSPAGSTSPQHGHDMTVSQPLSGNTGGFVGTRSPADVTGQLRGQSMTGGSMPNGPNSPAVSCHDHVVSRVPPIQSSQYQQYPTAPITHTSLPQTVQPQASRVAPLLSEQVNSPLSPVISEVSFEESIEDILTENPVCNLCGHRFFSNADFLQHVRNHFAKPAQHKKPQQPPAQENPPTATKPAMRDPYMPPGNSIFYRQSSSLPSLNLNAQMPTPPRDNGGIQDLSMNQNRTLQNPTNNSQSNTSSNAPSSTLYTFSTYSSQSTTNPMRPTMAMSVETSASTPRSTPEESDYSSPLSPIIPPLKESHLSLEQQLDIVGSNVSNNDSFLNDFQSSLSPAPPSYETTIKNKDKSSRKQQRPTPLSLRLDNKQSSPASITSSNPSYSVPPPVYSFNYIYSNTSLGSPKSTASSPEAPSTKSSMSSLSPGVETATLQLSPNTSSASSNSPQQYTSTASSPSSSQIQTSSNVFSYDFMPNSSQQKQPVQQQINYQQQAPRTNVTKAKSNQYQNPPMEQQQYQKPAPKKSSNSQGQMNANMSVYPPPSSYPDQFIPVPGFSPNQLNPAGVPPHPQMAAAYPQAAAAAHLFNAGFNPTAAALFNNPATHHPANYPPPGLNPFHQLLGPAAYHPQPFCCLLCPSRFHRQEELMYHINLLHYNTNPAMAPSMPNHPKPYPQHNNAAPKAPAQNGGKRGRTGEDDNQGPSKKRGKKTEEDIDLETLKKITALEWERKHGYWCTKCSTRFSSQAELVDHMSYSGNHNYNNRNKNQQ